MIKIVIVFKKREKPIPEFEQLGKALDELKKEIKKEFLHTLSVAGREGARAGRKLKEIISKI